MSERKHSGVGIASFILAVISVLGMIGAVMAAASMAQAMVADGGTVAPGAGGELPEGLGSLMIAAALMFFFVITALVGAVLGVVGLFQRERLKLFSVLGLTFNSLLVFVVLIVMVAGMLSAPALPGTFGGAESTLLNGAS